MLGTAWAAFRRRRSRSAGCTPAVWWALRPSEPPGRATRKAGGACPPESRVLVLLVYLPVGGPQLPGILEEGSISKRGWP